MSLMAAFQSAGLEPSEKMVKELADIQKKKDRHKTMLAEAPQKGYAAGYAYGMGNGPYQTNPYQPHSIYYNLWNDAFKEGYADS